MYLIQIYKLYVHFWTKFNQYECKAHYKTIFIIYEIFDSDLKPPP